MKFLPLQGTNLAVEVVAGDVAIGTLRVAKVRSARSTRVPLGIGGEVLDPAGHRFGIYSRTPLPAAR